MRVGGLSFKRQMFVNNGDVCEELVWLVESQIGGNNGIVSRFFKKVRKRVGKQMYVMFVFCLEFLFGVFIRKELGLWLYKKQVFGLRKGSYQDLIILGSIGGMGLCDFYVQ